MKPSIPWQLSLLTLVSLFLASCSVRPVAGGAKPYEVFSEPSPEMVDVSHGPGIPFGGIGTGFSVFG